MANSSRPKVDELLRIVTAVAFLLLPIWAYALFLSRDLNRATYPISAALILAINVALVHRVSQSDASLRRVMRTGYFQRFVMIGVYIVVLLAVYKGGDALLYFKSGASAADSFWKFGLLPSLANETGASFVVSVTGYLMILIGGSLVPVMLLYGSLAFWGSYFYLKAFRTALPERELWTPACLLFFFPSLLFWTSTVGKDAAILFLTGLFCFGFSRLMAGFNTSSLLLLLFSLWSMSKIRPHISMMFAAAALVTFVLIRGLPRLSQRASRVIGLAILAGAMVVLVPRVEAFLKLETLSLASSREFLEWQVDVTATGGSSFGSTPSFAGRLLLSPLLLIRPFPWEVHNATAAIASFESLFFLFLAWVNRRRLLANLRTARRNPLFLFTVVLTGMFLFAFSGIANFGVLTRQRVMIFPWLFALFSPIEAPERLKEAGAAEEQKPEALGRMPDALGRPSP